MKCAFIAEFPRPDGSREYKWVGEERVCAISQESFRHNPKLLADVPWKLRLVEEDDTLRYYERLDMKEGTMDTQQQAVFHKTCDELDQRIEKLESSVGEFGPHEIVERLCSLEEDGHAALLDRRLTNLGIGHEELAKSVNGLRKIIYNHLKQTENPMTGELLKRHSYALTLDCHSCGRRLVFLGYGEHGQGRRDAEKKARGSMFYEPTSRTMAAYCVECVSPDG